MNIKIAVRFPDEDKLYPGVCSNPVVFICPVGNKYSAYLRQYRSHTKCTFHYVPSGSRRIEFNREYYLPKRVYEIREIA